MKKFKSPLTMMEEAVACALRVTLTEPEPYGYRSARPTVQAQMMMLGADDGAPELHALATMAFRPLLLSASERARVVDWSLGYYGRPTRVPPGNWPRRAVPGTRLRNDFFVAADELARFLSTRLGVVESLMFYPVHPPTAVRVFGVLVLPASELRSSQLADVYEDEVADFITLAARRRADELHVWAEDARSRTRPALVG